MYKIAIFGGTFDPIHYGHLKTSVNIQSYFHFDSYRFLPCKIPNLKNPPIANAQQRLQMLHLALNSEEFKDIKPFSVDLRELNRSTPSYMVETLNSFRNEYEKASISLILGFDAFLSLPQWHQWKKILKLANLLVINRPSTIIPLPKTLQEFLKQHQSTQVEDILTHQFGHICFFDAGNYEISSTQVRESFNQESKNYLPNAVYQYIQKQRLYDIN